MHDEKERIIFNRKGFFRMNRKFVTVLMAACLIVTLFAGCGSKDQDALSTGPDVGASSTQEPGTAAGGTGSKPAAWQKAE